MIMIRTLTEKLPFAGLEYIHRTDQSYALAIRNQHGFDLENPYLINILTAEEYDRCTSPLTGACFIVGRPLKNSFPDEQEIVIFPDFVDIEILLKDCMHIMSEYERFSQYKQVLDMAVYGKHDFNSVLKAFSGFYDNPVCFCDPGGSVLFYANLRDNLEEYDQSIRYWTSLGYVPYDYSLENGNVAGDSRVATSPVPVIIDTGYASKARRMAYRTCRIEDHYNNYFCVVEAHHPYLPFDRDALIYTADLVTDNFSAAQSLNQVETPRNHVLRSLINRKIQDEADMQDRMKRCHITDSAWYQLFVIGFRDNRNGEHDPNHLTPLVYLRNNLRNADPLLLQIIDDRQQLVILAQASEKTAFQSRLDKISSHLKKLPELYLSISRPYQKIMNTPDKYKEAYLAWETGGNFFPDQFCYSFEELGIPVLLSLTNKQTDVSSLLTKGVFPLYQTDKEKGSEYFRTLLEYLSCNLNILECAKKLHIHRNTAIYRLSKAKQAVDVDFDCFDDIVKLYLSMRYVELFSQ